jgi:hypothetical protein
LRHASAGGTGNGTAPAGAKAGNAPVVVGEAGLSIGGCESGAGRA